MKQLTLLFVLALLVSCQQETTNTELIMHTNQGDIVLELYNDTPLHRDNFIKLANDSTLDSLLFHRVIENFMIQGGDPDSKYAKSGAQLGNGGPGYRIPAEFDSTLYHKKGALATARLGDAQNPKKESSGSQFYLAQGRVYTLEQLKRIEESKRKTTPAMNMEEIPDFKFTEEQIKSYTTVGGIPFLDAGYTVFGQVIKGIEVIDKIAAVKVDRANGNRPLDDVRMKVEMIYLSKEDKATLLNKEEK